MQVSNHERFVSLCEKHFIQMVYPEYISEYIML